MAGRIKNNQPMWLAIAWAGVAAAVVSTLVQVLLWRVFTDEFPAALFRDARLTAALVLGSRVLPPPATFGFEIWIVAILIHFALSISYAAVLFPFAMRLGGSGSFMAGAGFGILLYAVNLYGFTEVFPWFVQARGWIAAVAHVAFGVSAIFACRCRHFKSG